MLTTNLYLKKHKTNTYGEAPLTIRLTKNRKSKYIPLDIRLNPELHWSQKGQKVKSKHPNSVRLNNFISMKLSEVNDIILQHRSKKIDIEFQDIVDQFLGKQPASFFQYAETFINRLENSDQIGTAGRYKSVINKLKRYMNGSDLNFDQVDFTFLCEYESHLRSIGNKVNTIHSNMKTIRAILYSAMKEEITPQANNPFFKYKLKTESTFKERLTEEEIEKICLLELPENELITHARNIFLFSFYFAGIRIGDALRMKWKNIINNKLSYRMSKTGIYRILPVHQRAHELLHYYQKSKVNDDSFIFPFLGGIEFNGQESIYKVVSSKTAQINLQLKEVTKRAGIKKKITTHIARHSFSDIARNKGSNLYDLSKTLGHSSIQITERYLASFDQGAVESVFNDMFSD